MGIGIKAPKLEEVARSLGRFERRGLVLQKRVIEAWAAKIVSVARQVLERTTSSGSSGRLATSLGWRARVRKGRGTAAVVNWGYYYGSVLEYGPHKMRTWVIRAKWAKALRWVTPGGVAYAKWIRFKWTPSMLRPHVRPAMESTTSWAMDTLSKALAAAFEEAR